MKKKKKEDYRFYKGNEGDWNETVGGKNYKKDYQEWINSQPDLIKEHRVRRELDLIVNELVFAEIKHPNWPNDDMYKQLAIVLEEMSEVGKAVLQFHDEGLLKSDVAHELRQTAAIV